VEDFLYSKHTLEHYGFTEEVLHTFNKNNRQFAVKLEHKQQ